MAETPPAGWYPAPHANDESRYWDGQRWVDSPTAGAASAPQQPVSTYAQPGTPQTMTVPPPAPVNTKGLALTALILGIVAFLTGLVPWLGLILAIAAIAVGIFALIKKQSKALSITGVALGGIAFVTGVIVTVSFSAFLNAAGTASQIGEEPITIPTAASEESVNPETPAAEEEPAAESPATEEEPAPEAPAADGTVSNPFPQPYTAEGFLGGDKYTLTGRVIDANANALVKGWNQFNSDAPAGFKYVVVELTMTGLDPDGVEPSLAAFDLSLATSEGNRYSTEFIVFGEGMPSMTDGPTLYPGNAFTGFTAYIVPEAAQAFLLHDNGNYISF